MGLLSGATGAGLGGFFEKVGAGVTDRENWTRKTAWEEAKMEKMWGYEKQKAGMTAEAAKTDRQFEVVGNTIDTLLDQYKNINNRLRGDAGFTRVTNDDQVTALEGERDKIRMQMQRLTGTYLNMAGFSSDYTHDLMIGMFTPDGNLTKQGEEVATAAANATGEKRTGGLWSGFTELIKEAWEYSGEKGKELIDDWESFKADNGPSQGEPLTNIEALRKIYEAVREGEMLSDAEMDEWGSLFGTDVEINKAAIEAIKSSPEKVIEFIQEYLPKVKEAVKKAAKKAGYRYRDDLGGPAESDSSTITTPLQSSVTDPDLEYARLVAAEERGDFYPNDESLVAGPGGFIGSVVTGAAGALGTSNRGMLSKADREEIIEGVAVGQLMGGGSTYSGIPQEDLAAQTVTEAFTEGLQGAIPRSELNLEPPPSSARWYGEKRGSDWIGSTQAIDALSEKGPAFDAVTEWETTERKYRLVKGLKNIINKAESAAHGFFAVAGSTKGDPNLTSMTIGEVHKKYGDKAVGIGQFKRRFLIDNAKKYLGYNIKELDAMPFNEATQNKFMEFGIEDAGIDAYLNGDITIDQFHARLAKIWRGLPPHGTSKKGDPSDNRGNKAQLPGTELREVITQAVTEAFTEGLQGAIPNHFNRE